VSGPRRASMPVRASAFGAHALSPRGRVLTLRWLPAVPAGTRSGEAACRNIPADSQEIGAGYKRRNRPFGIVLLNPFSRIRA
jgi:hypothetical protein